MQLPIYIKNAQPNIMKPNIIMGAVATAVFALVFVALVATAPSSFPGRTSSRRGCHTRASTSACGCATPTNRSSAPRSRAWTAIAAATSRISKSAASLANLVQLHIPRA